MIKSGKQSESKYLEKIMLFDEIKEFISSIVS